MIIENLSQLRNYARDLPWYKRLFFPRALWAKLTEPTASEQEVGILYAQISDSWLGRFYEWLFPDLNGFFQERSLISISNGQPIEQQYSPTSSAAALIEAIRFHDHEKIDRITDLPPEERPDPDALVNALRVSIDAEYTTFGLLKANLYDTSMISRALVEAITDEQWEAIGVFMHFSLLRKGLTSESINQVVLLAARSRKIHELNELLDHFEVVDSLSIDTMGQVLLHFVGTLQHEHDSDVDIVRRILNFQTIEHINLGEHVIKEAYLRLIKCGRVKTCMMFQNIPGTHQLDREGIIQSLKEAAQQRHYEMVLYYIQKIPSDRRLELLQTKSVINDDRPFASRRLPKKAHTLQWAICRSVTEDIQCILGSLANEPERYALINNMSDNDDYSPLLLAAFDGWAANLQLMLDALSPEHVIEVILPKKISFLTPLNEFECFPKEHYQRSIMPILLTKLFGERRHLYAAYHDLESRCDMKCLKELRNHYLDKHFPMRTTVGLTLFKRSFSISGYSLSSEELDLVGRVVLYQKYHVFDSRQRKKIEDRMNDYETRMAPAVLSTVLTAGVV